MKVCKKGHEYGEDRARCPKCQSAYDRTYYQVRIKTSEQKWNSRQRAREALYRKQKLDPRWVRLINCRSQIGYERGAIRRLLSRVQRKEKKLIRLIRERDQLVAQVRGKRGSG